ncbi:hypothetical protein GCM10010387_65760 [Streptomyces inusitatus]|uniref:Uncharacterized protein n=1 Tax=Streptomyces inusitatus TaxID=68221 RepID=A0A918QP11_9ACTN|nr:hypothetical protein GCM10010387_65760 [Streptomyces inusitatus]
MAHGPPGAKRGCWLRPPGKKRGGPLGEALCIHVIRVRGEALRLNEQARPEKITALPNSHQGRYSGSRTTAGVAMPLWSSATAFSSTL